MICFSLCGIFHSMAYGSYCNYLNEIHFSNIPIKLKPSCENFLPNKVL